MTHKDDFVEILFDIQNAEYERVSYIFSIARTNAVMKIRSCLIGSILTSFAIEETCESFAVNSRIEVVLCNSFGHVFK